ncbi:MAG: hypothetical protein PHE83_07890 [Opitutaceae bacterium]|nr:hypothetical protein [Opitutaceae bacterium]
MTIVEFLALSARPESSPHDYGLICSAKKMIPDGIKAGCEGFTLYWLLYDVGSCIDMNRMSDSSRRDFPERVRGSHMATKEETCFAECSISRYSPPDRTYLLCFCARLKFADYREVPSAQFSGQMYAPSHDYSQFVFVQNSGEYAALGLNAIRRYSAPVYELSKTLEEVLALLPDARSELSLLWIEPIGFSSPPVLFIPYGLTTPISSECYPRYAEPAG